MQRLVFDQDFRMPVEEAFAYLSMHENLEGLLGAKVNTVKEGTDGERYGVGSVRQLKVGPLPPFEETITEVVPNELIRYRITKGSPLRNHSGEMRFTPNADGGSHLHYEISFGAVVPGLDALLAPGLRRNINKGLQKIDSPA
ncbi:MAG: SRPBCC family protein [Solirubrobacterales bacterium]|nr:SRPBCC family protein [Solirubrobacterales bacterium]